MATKATVTYKDFAGVTHDIKFYGFDDKATQSRFFIDYNTPGPTHDVRRFNPAGVSGNFVTRLGSRGSNVELTVRYQGPINDIALLWKADREAFAEYSCAITDTVIPFSRCTLAPNSGNRITDEMAAGTSGDIFYHVRYLFKSED